MKNKIIKVSFVLGAMVFMAVAFNSIVFAKTPASTTKLQNKINAEEGRVAELKVTLDSKLGINHNLKKGSTGNDVKLLQKFLNVYGVYPEGLVTGYFGVLTEKAVKKFQEKELIDSIGIAGPKTRTQIIKISQQQADKKSITFIAPEITDVVLSTDIAENGSAKTPSASFAKTTQNMYAVLSLKNAMQDTQISYIRYYKNTYIDSEVSHPSRSGLKYLHFQWSLKTHKNRTVGDYSIVFYANGKKLKTIQYTIY